MQVWFFERDCKNLAQTRDKCNHCLSNQRSVALSHLNKESMNQDSSCHPVKTLQCSTSALLDFFLSSFKSLQVFVAFLIVDSEIVPVVEMPACEAATRRAKG